MPFDTYLYLQRLVENDMRKVEQDFRTACWFILPENRMDAHRALTEEYTKQRRTLEELYASCALTYKNHPLEKMRQFWGLPK